MDYFKILPEEITLDILTRLPVESVLESKLFVGSFNGLICLLTHAENQPFWICNPITREYVTLPKIKRDCFHTDEYGCWMFGFGYVSSTSEYKVVVIYVSKTETHVEVRIYTIGSGNGWKKLGKFNYGWSPYNSLGIYVSGALYWVDRKVEMIIIFNLAEEKFAEHLLPPPLVQDRRYRTIGWVLNGFLSFVVFVAADRYSRFYDIWLLKNKNENHDMKEGEEHQSFVWSKKFRIDDSQLLAVTKGDGVFTYSSNYLSIYDRKTSTSKKLVKFTNAIEVYPHQNTLVSLKQLGEEDTKIMESFETAETNNHDYPLKKLQEDVNPEYIYL
ncbi:F-box/kelch-repeat protein At3g23880-like [Papaver somniferum]|uniref:F-box/kelch-repeat protein At3g23880-like n=1 Tax=Papaver somniferum TaxID=3469 RepID=UPI000E701C12|nr:F-box/kelch-repeat protein At3g23880-like [Papaver somniferum]